jgi:hypothetical protein
MKFPSTEKYWSHKILHLPVTESYISLLSRKFNVHAKDRCSHNGKDYRNNAYPANKLSHYIRNELWKSHIYRKSSNRHGSKNKEWKISSTNNINCCARCGGCDWHRGVDCLACYQEKVKQLRIIGWGWAGYQNYSDQGQHYLPKRSEAEADNADRCLNNSDILRTPNSIILLFNIHSAKKPAEAIVKTK